MNIVGHHHISMYTKDAKRNKDFLHKCPWITIS